MRGKGQGWDDRRISVFIGTLLRTGVIASALLVILGGVIYLFRQGFALPDYRIFRGEPAELLHVKGIIRYAFAFHGRGLIQLGLLVLIATPIARVALSVFAFFRQQDRLYTALTLIVLAALSYSLFFGR